MAKNAPKPTVAMTAGKNKPVNNVIKFEDLVQQLKQGVPVAKSKKAGAKAVHGDHLTEIQQLAADLEARLRAVRRAQSDQAPPVAAARRKRQKK